MSRFLMVLGAVGGCIPRLETENGPSGGGDWVAPDNAWPMAEPPADLVAGGFDPGEVAPDLRLVDQAGDEVSLWQFHGNVILLDISTIWCVPCQALAQHTEATWQAYRDQGFVYVTVLQQDNEGNPPDDADLDSWASQFGITAPVVADGGETAIDAVPLVGGSRAYPGVLVIDRDMVVRKAMEVPTAEDVDEAIAEVL